MILVFWSSSPLTPLPSKHWLMIQRPVLFLFLIRMRADCTMHILLQGTSELTFFFISYHRKPMPDTSCSDRIFLAPSWVLAIHAYSKCFFNSYHIQSPCTSLKRQGKVDALTVLQVVENSWTHPQRGHFVALLQYKSTGGKDPYNRFSFPFRINSLKLNVYWYDSS